MNQIVERWGIYEWAAKADTSALANPFADAWLRAIVTGPDGSHTVEGFYDGDNTYRLRYMPEQAGDYSLRTRSNMPALDGSEARFTAKPASEGNHGPAVADGTHFRYADGSPCFIMGTTAYVWHHRPAQIRAQTLESFSANGFNKIRMLFFPKHYTGAYGAIDVSYEPPCYPFCGAPKSFDFKRPNPQYFAVFEERLVELLERGIFADVILFHPYDFGHWDIDAGMDEDDALFYLRYLIARIACYRNIWWSLANEYDIIMEPDHTTMRIGENRRNWDVIGEFIKARDPSHHLISCHNISFGLIYPDRSWMTHVSYQHPDAYTLLLELKHRYQKPVINDEYQYEGNTPDDWGNSSAELALERHWLSVMAGGYATHGEAYIRGDNNRDIFWAYGGEMTGQSARRLGFLRRIVESCPFETMERNHVNGDGRHYFALYGGGVYLIFVRDDMEGKTLWLGDWRTERYTAAYRVSIFDVWNCRKISEETLPSTRRLPLKAWTAMRLERIQGN